MLGHGFNAVALRQRCGRARGVLAHRGGSMLYPEDSLQAMASSVADGNGALEMDAWLLSDGAIGVMHDATVDRTTTGTGTVTTFTASTWAALTLDGSSWLGGNASDVAPPLLSAILSATSSSGATYYIECKHSAVAGPLLTLINGSGIAKSRFVVCSFTLSDLAAFEAAGVRTQFLSSDGSQLAAVSATSTRIVGMSSAVSLATIATWAAAGFRVQIWTVDRRYVRDTFPGAYDMISSEPTYIKGSAPIATQDAWANGKWMPGMLAVDGNTTELSRGRILAGGWWGWSTTTTGIPGVLQGWACPIKGNPAANDFILDFCVKIDAAQDVAQWGSCFIADVGTADRPYVDGTANPAISGWHVLYRKNGQLQIYKSTGGVGALQQTYAGAAVADGEEFRIQITVTPTTIRAARVNVSTGVEIGGVTVTDSAFRGGYFHLLRKNAAVKYRNARVS